MNLLFLLLGALLTHLGQLHLGRRQESSQERAERREAYTEWFSLQRTTRRRLEHLYRIALKSVNDEAGIQEVLTTCQELEPLVMNLMRALYRTCLLEPSKDIQTMLADCTDATEAVYVIATKGLGPDPAMMSMLVEVRRMEERFKALGPNHAEYASVKQDLEALRRRVNDFFQVHLSRIREDNEQVMSAYKQISQLSKDLFGLVKGTVR
jgi:hypothetical protein